jgi:hypothetical protein
VVARHEPDGGHRYEADGCHRHQAEPPASGGPQGRVRALIGGS